MRIDVAELLKKPVGSTQIYHIDDTFEEKVINGKIIITRTNRGILVHGELKTDIDGFCCRCLVQISNDAQFTFSEEYIPIRGISSDNSQELENPNDKFYIDNNKIIDLSEVFRQYIILAEPMKLLCMPGCQGLCPTCGQNLNKKLCNCSAEQKDIRWSKLVPFTKEDKI